MPVLFMMVWQDVQPTLHAAALRRVLALGMVEHVDAAKLLGEALILSKVGQFRLRQGGLEELLTSLRCSCLELLGQLMAMLVGQAFGPRGKPCKLFL